MGKMVIKVIVVLMFFIVIMVYVVIILFIASFAIFASKSCKNTEKGDSDQCLVCAAPNLYFKYTTIQMIRTMIFVYEKYGTGPVGGLVRGCKCRFKDFLQKSIKQLENKLKV